MSVSHPKNVSYDNDLEGSSRQWTMEFNEFLFCPLVPKTPRSVSLPRHSLTPLPCTHTWAVCHRSPFLSLPSASKVGSGVALSPGGSCLPKAILSGGLRSPEGDCWALVQLGGRTQIPDACLMLPCGRDRCVSSGSGVEVSNFFVMNS